MRKALLFLSIILLISTSFYAQKINVIHQKAPVSIYTFNFLEKDIHSISSLKKRLNITSFKFVIISSEDIDNGMASLDFRNLNRESSSFVYDDYKRYNNTNFLKGFMRKYDPTRWYVQCFPNTFDVQPLN